MASIAINVAISVGVGLLKNALMSDVVSNQEGPRLGSSQITSANEGANISRIYNTMRSGGQVIWATTFREVVETTTESSSAGGKGGPKQVSNNTTYTYFTSFAVGICEGEAGVKLRTVYLDGVAVDLSTLTYRFYDGSADQLPDSKIVSVEGSDNTPAYRGLCYIVFDEMDLTNYSNRIPQVTVEVTRTMGEDDPDSLASTVRSVNIIPGSGEQILATEVITNIAGGGASLPINVHTSGDDTDFVVSMDQLNDELPMVNSASLVVSWFGSSIDATTCLVQPKVENLTNSTSPHQWSVTDRVRSNAAVISTDGSGNPVYGGTPSDISVRQALTDMKDRGLRTMFYPFILMDTTGFPWRGRISGDATNFMGTASPSDYGTWNGTSLPYTGPVEWTQRRMILHYAALVSDIMVAGDAFLVGSEMVGLSTSDPLWGDRVASLIADVRTLLPAGVLVSYAADWSEYKEDTLSAVWSVADFVGIDNYLPLTDWRDGDEDYSIEHFMAGVEGGEFYDYYYLTEEDRNNAIRTPIDQPQFRQKDIRYWSATNHPAKPVWFTEFGCPAVDKGANQPNVFYDPKSDESFFPYHSDGTSNVIVQNLYLRAMLQYWGDDGFIDPQNMFVWTWDSRPYPAYPARSDVWSDGDNWLLGHWLTGRTGLMTLGRLVKILMLEAGVPESQFNVDELEISGVQVRGMLTNSVKSTRDVLQNLMTTYLFDVFEDGDGFHFTMRQAPDTITIDVDDMIIDDNGASYTKTRLQDTDLPDRTQVTFLDETRDYQPGSADGHTVTGYSTRVATFTSNCALPFDYGRTLADILTQEQWTRKNAIEFSLPLNYLAIRPGDSFPMELGGVTRNYRIEGVATGDQLDVSAVGFSEVIYDTNNLAIVTPTSAVVNSYGIPLVVFADIPLIDADSVNLWSPRVMATQNPWPGGVNLLESDGDGGHVLNNLIPAPAVIGELVDDLPRGVTALWDTDNSLTVKLYDTSYNLTSRSDLSVLNGSNALAVITPNGDWEVLQFATSVLNPDGSYTLSRLLRGLLGTEPFMVDLIPTGSVFFVYSDTYFNVIKSSTSRLGLEVDMRYGPVNVDTNDNRYTDQTVTPLGVALRPYSPVHLRQTKQSNGDILLSWVRRTRFEGDSWSGVDVPLNEETEAFEIDVTGGQTLSVVGSSSILYTLAQQTTDFGGGQSTVDWTVYQMSALYGRGAPATN